MTFQVCYTKNNHKMSNVMSLKNLSNKVTRNGFDMSERRAITGKVGEILPVFVLETIPGDEVSINPSHFTRTMPLNTAAYANLKEYMHFYFVPYRLLHAGLDSFLTDNKENATRASSINQAQVINDKLPYFSYLDLANYIVACRKKNVKNQTGYKHAQTTVKLLEYLGYGDFSRFLTEDVTLSGAEVNIRMSPLILLAYQKIYQDHFRNKQWERTSPETSNMDYAPFGSALPIITALSGKYNNNQFVNDLFSMRYCDYAKDYFFGLLPNAQYGDFAVVEGKVKPTEPTAHIHNDVMQGQPHIGQLTVGDLGVVASEWKTNASIIAFRKAEALQKYKEIKQSGEQDYQSYLEKIFNVSVSDDRSDQCRYLGGYDSIVDISEVINNNLVDADADIKGKGVSSSGGQNIRFTCNEFGVIMGIYTARPTLDYALDAPSRAVMRVSADDFANPVFDRIGMQTVPVSELSSPYEMKKRMPNANVTGSIGYAPRYYDYKTTYNKVLGEFRRSLRAWVAPLTSQTIFDKLLATTSGGSINLNLTYLSFKVNPNVMDAIFKHHVNDSTETDQLWLNISIGCPIVRRLDYDGLPY